MNSFSGMQKAIDFEIHRQVSPPHPPRAQAPMVLNAFCTEQLPGVLKCRGMCIVPEDTHHRVGALAASSISGITSTWRSMWCLRPSGNRCVIPGYLRTTLLMGSMSDRLRFDPQVELIESGRGAEVVQETRSWDEVKQATASMRSKEGLADYRFFPEPDLSLLTITEDDIAAAAVRSPTQPLNLC